MEIKIALAGNPNSGKTTLFNALTGSNQFVGNWPGVTVEKKEGHLKDREDVIVVDLPGVYSLSPYTMEEVIARNFLVNERPDAILNIVDGTNLERNLYLTTQLIDLGIPVVVAVNMVDVIRKKGDNIDFDALSRALGCKIVEISALKEEGIGEAVEAAIAIAGEKKVSVPLHSFSGAVEHALAHIEEATVHGLPAEQQRWYAIKIFERDERVLSELDIDKETLAHIEEDIKAAERELDDDAESIIINDRYEFITKLVRKYVKKKDTGRLSTSDKIDKVVTNRFLALPIFAAIMFLVYYISVSTVGTWVTDWTNDGLFGDGWHLFGSGEYEEAVDSYGNETLFSNTELSEIIANAENSGITGADELKGAFDEKDYFAFEEAYGSYGEKLSETGFDISASVDPVLEGTPDPSEYGVWVPGVPVLADKLLLDENGEPVVAEWLYSLIQEGIIGGVGAVLGFVPQMIVLFILLAFLESCGYMARIAFMMDRIFRNFGLSGKSFIPILIGTGCGVPGIMASRTIENEKDRRMTIITTTFIPCGAKLPIIALITAALFDGAWWVAPSAYFIGIAAILISGIMLKKTKPFASDPTPFVMELPAYHMPTFTSLIRSMWERASSFIKKAGTVILLSSIIIWLGSKLGFVESSFCFSTEMALENSLLGYLGSGLKWLFAPLGFNNIKATIATLMGLIAKEEVVGVFGVLDFEGMGALAGYSFLVFNLLCAPCFAAMGAIRREMNSAKWTAFAITYQCVFAYAVSLVIYQFGNAFGGNMNIIGFIAALLAIAFVVFMLVKKPYTEKK
ncbi:MAG: ferrous iron transporter B [Ruminococcaceae bacterium]|nr:ferrous iron transporter B [Oscillospiraceae bacterium]